MLRLFIYPTWWSASLFGSAMVALAGIWLMPLRTHQIYLSIAAGLGVAVSLMIQISLPLIILLRRSQNNEVDALLADVMLPVAFRYGRSVWLENPQDNLVRGQLKRYSFEALIGQLVAVVVLMFWLLSAYQIAPTLVIVVLTMIGSTAFLDASVGNSMAPGLAFLATGLITEPIPPTTPWSHLFGFIFFFIGLYLGIRTIFWVGQRISNSLHRPFNKICSRFDLGWLRMEMWLPLCFVTRFIHGGPAVIREIKSRDECWRPTVLTLLKRTRYAIMDISKIEIGSELLWELETCYEKKVKLLLICNLDELERAVSVVRATIPNAVVLPDDFHDSKALGRLSKSDTRVVQIFAYGENQAFNRFHTQALVFFDEITLDEWFDAIARPR